MLLWRCGRSFALRALQSRLAIIGWRATFAICSGTRAIDRSTLPLSVACRLGHLQLALRPQMSQAMPLVDDRVVSVVFCLLRLARARSREGWTMTESSSAGYIILGQVEQYLVIIHIHVSIRQNTRDMLVLHARFFHHIE